MHFGSLIQRIPSGLPLFVAATLAVLPAAAGAQQWSMASAFPATNFQTQNVQAFIDEIKAASGGKLSITLHSNQSLVTMPQIKRAVRTEQVQLGEIVLSAYGNEDPFYEVDSIPVLSQGHDNARRLWAASKPYIEKRLRAEGLVPLFSVIWPSQGIYSKKPIAALGDLKGVKFRAYNPATARMAELIGAVPTTVQQAEVSQAFATGIIEAMVTSALTGLETQAWDFVSHYYDVRVINNKNIVFVNEKAFNRLDAATRAMVLQAAAKAEARGWEASARMMDDVNQKLAAKGMKVIAPTPALNDELRKIGDTMTADWLKRAGADGRTMLDAYRAK
ncbi:MAG: TRAP transporter substrate-binding protein [Lautropia sp.]